jgi:hypothetical protein
VVHFCFDKSEMAHSADYVFLQPGASLPFKVGLFCFRFKGPGTYALTAYFQDENPNPGTIPGTPVLRGEVRSPPVTIGITNSSAK